MLSTSEIAELEADLFASRSATSDPKQQRKYDLLMEVMENYKKQSLVCGASGCQALHISGAIQALLDTERDLIADYLRDVAKGCDHPVEQADYFLRDYADAIERNEHRAKNR